MLVSFTGAQSTGKSTLLDAIVRANEYNNGIVFVPELTRVLKREYNIPINEEASAMTQYQITCDHYKHAFKKESSIVKLKILDRCALDGTVYCNYFNTQRQLQTSTLLGPDLNGDYNTDWEKATRMSERYLPDMMEKYDILFYTDPKDVPLVDDGERSASVKFRNGIIELFEDYITRPLYANKVITLSGTVEERLATIRDAISFLDSSIEIKIRN